MKDGQVKELDTPLKLLHNRHSEFSQMVDKTGADNACRLYQMAANEADKRTDDESTILLVSSV